MWPDPSAVIEVRGTIHTVSLSRPPGRSDSAAGGDFITRADRRVQLPASERRSADRLVVASVISSSSALLHRRRHRRRADDGD